jgi:hypothetical protein
VHVNGLLKREGVSFDYTNDATANTVTFASPLAEDDLVTIYKVRARRPSQATAGPTADRSGRRRSSPSSSTQTRCFTSSRTASSSARAARNDYTLQPATNTLTFTSTVPSGNLVTIVTVENVSAQAVTGLMLEGNYTDSATGLIPYAKLLVPNGAIAQSKVSGLAAALADSANIVISATLPASPYVGLLWLDTATAPNQLKYYDGVQWLRTSPESTLPTFVTGNANQYVRVNGTGTALEYATLDLSSVIPVTQKGAANGVAQLDSTGRLPASQLPQTLSSTSIFLTVGTPSNTSYSITRIFRQKLRIDGLALRVASGTCSVQITSTASPSAIRTPSPRPRPSSRSARPSTSTRPAQPDHRLRRLEQRGLHEPRSRHRSERDRPMRIRPGTPADVWDCVALGVQNHFESHFRDLPYVPEKVEAYFRSFIENDDCLGLVAVNANQVSSAATWPPISRRTSSTTNSRPPISWSMSPPPIAGRAPPTA